MSWILKRIAADGKHRRGKARNPLQLSQAMLLLILRHGSFSWDVGKDRSVIRNNIDKRKHPEWIFDKEGSENKKRFREVITE